MRFCIIFVNKKMIEYISITNCLSMRETFKFSFLATREKDKFDDGNSSWNDIVAGRKVSKLLFILGNNATGKTNFISAVRTMQNLIISRPVERDYELEFMPFLLDDISKYKPTTFEISFFVNEARYRYTISYNKEAIEKESLFQTNRDKEILIYIRTHNYEREISNIEFGTKLRLGLDEQKEIINHTPKNTSVLASFWSLNIYSEILKGCYLFFRDKIAFNMNISENLADILSKGSVTEQRRLKNDVLLFLNVIKSNIVDYKITEHKARYSIPPQLLERMNSRNELFPEFSDLMREGESVFRTISFIHETVNGRFQLEEEMESDGTLHLIRLIAMAQTLINNGMIVFLDEECESIHELALKYILSCYIRLSYHCQLVIAGQDTSFLSYDKLRRDSLRIFKKDADGNTYLFKSDDNKLYQANTNLRNYVYKHSDLIDVYSSLFGEFPVEEFIRTVLSKRK